MNWRLTSSEDQSWAGVDQAGLTRPPSTGAGAAVPTSQRAEPSVGPPNRLLLPLLARLMSSATRHPSHGQTAILGLVSQPMTEPVRMVNSL